MNASLDMEGPVRHFIAVNHHRFHDVRLLEFAILSAVDGAARLRVARPAEPVRLVLFYQPEGIEDGLMARLRSIEGLFAFALPAGSNGCGLNAQLDMAAQLGAEIFYRVDADDPVHAERFVRQSCVLEQTGADVAGGGLRYNNLDSGDLLEVLPVAHPGAWDYLTNCAMLHPSLAFRLSSLTNAGLRYWPHRLEDKHLGLQIARHGLKLVNDPLIYGDYNLDPGSRSGMTAARTNLSLNLAYLWQVRRLDLAPAAVVLFVASALFPAQWLRRLRKVMRRGIKNGEAPELTPCSEYADENDGEKTARRPRGQARTGRHR